MPQGTNARGYSAGRFVLEIDGQAVGSLSTVEGGEPFAAVIADPADANHVVRKRPGAVNYEPIRVSFGAGMGALLYQWMTELLKRNQLTKSGAIIFLDYNSVEQARLEFQNARITEIAFPAMDAASKDSARFTLTLQPEVTRFNKAKASTKSPIISEKAKKVLKSSNFRLAIAGSILDKIHKIDSITVKQALPDDLRAAVVHPLEISNLAFTLPDGDAAPMFDWFEEFIIKGQINKERSGTVEFLEPDLSAALFTLTLSNLGIVRIHREVTADGAGLLTGVRVECYCEGLAFSADKGAAAAAPAPTDGSTATLVTAVVDILASRVPELGTRTRPPIASPTDKGATPELVARRLQATERPGMSDDRSGSKRDDGILIGLQWATDTATLGELKQIAALETGDWTAMRLENNHSLITQLKKDGLVQPGDGPLDLKRDGLIEGIVTGAARVLQTAAPHLDHDKGLSELSTQDQLALQKIMDKQSQLEAMISNVMKAAAEVAQSIAANLKA
jgi:T4-like virus tail tube protein gp19